MPKDQQFSIDEQRQLREQLLCELRNEGERLCQELEALAQAMVDQHARGSTTDVDEAAHDGQQTELRSELNAPQRRGDDSNDRCNGCADE